MAPRGLAWEVLLLGWLGFWLSFGIMHVLPLPIALVPVVGCWAGLIATAWWLRPRAVAVRRRP